MQANEKSPLRVVNERTSRIGEGCRIKGELFLTGKAEIHGEVHGRIFSEGELRIGLDAIVAARIEAESLWIEGGVVGEIRCSKRLELCSGARVAGNITTPVLVIEDGVRYEGRCSMTRDEEEEEREVVFLHSEESES